MPKAYIPFYIFMMNLNKDNMVKSHKSSGVNCDDADRRHQEEEREASSRPKQGA